MMQKNSLTLLALIFMLQGLLVAEDNSAARKNTPETQPSVARTSPQDFQEDAKLLAWIRSHENCDEPEKIFKQATEFSRKAPQADDSLFAIRLVLAKADYWNKNSLPGSQEMAAIAVTELGKIHETKTPQQSIEYSMVLAEVHRLCQQYEKASQLLERCLQNYFPAVLKDRRIAPCNMPLSARVLLEKLGGLYLTQAESTLDMKDKEKYYSLAAGCLIRAAAGYYDVEAKMPDTLPSQLILQITACRDALQILGRQLNVPEFLKTSLKESNIGLVRQLVSQQNYLAALKLIEKSEPSVIMLEMKLSCFAGLDRPDDAVKLAEQMAKQNGQDTRVQDALLESAKRLEARNRLPQASVIYYLFAQAAPQHQRAAAAMLKRADYCRSAGQLDGAAEIYEKTAAVFDSHAELSCGCHINAVQCYQQNKEYRNALNCSQKAESISKAAASQKIQAILLVAQNALQLALQNGTSVEERKELGLLAGKKFAVLLEDKKLPTATQIQLLQAAELSAEIAGMLEKAFSYFQSYLVSSGIDEKICSEMAKRIIRLAALQKNSPIIVKTVELSIRKPLPDAISTGIFAIGYLEKLQDAKSVLAVAKVLSSIVGTQSSYLVALSDTLQSPCMDNYRKESNLLLIAMISPRLAELEKEKSPALGKLLFTASMAYSEISDNENALKMLDKLLAMPAVYRSMDAKLLHGDLLVRVGQYEKARKDYQEIIIISQDRTFAIIATEKMAETYRHEKNWKKMLATASYCLPLLDRADTLTLEQKTAMKKCLELICEGYDKLNMPEQLLKMKSLYSKIYPDAPMNSEYNKKPQAATVK